MLYNGNIFRELMLKTCSEFQLFQNFVLNMHLKFITRNSFDRSANIYKKKKMSKCGKSQEEIIVVICISSCEISFGKDRQDFNNDIKIICDAKRNVWKIVSCCWHRSTRSHHFDLSVTSGNKIFGQQFFFFNTFIFSLALAIIVHWAVTKISRLCFAPSFSLQLYVSVSLSFCYFQVTIDGKRNQTS